MENCSICGAVKPWYFAGALFFCKNHKKEASEEMKKLTDRYLSRRSVREFHYQQETKQI
jgi:hypothetical protein